MAIHLLIAEDDPEDRSFIERALQNIDFAGVVEFANNGEEVINYLQSIQRQHANPNNRTYPKVVLLDLNMPRLNGWETLEWLKSNTKWSDIPVIIFTTSTSEVDIQASYKNGASCFIAKPDSYIGYIEIFKNLIKFWNNTVLLPKL